MLPVQVRTGQRQGRGQLACCAVACMRTRDDVHHSLSSSGDQRVARKGGPMVSRLHGICHLLLDQHCSNGQPTCISQCNRILRDWNLLLV